jgi:hypothetical protein
LDLHIQWLDAGLAICRRAAYGTENMSTQEVITAGAAAELKITGLYQPRAEPEHDGPGQRHFLAISELRV